jgi:hypothetical protein
MRWGDVVQAIAAAAAQNAVLASIYGETVRLAAPAQEHVVPALEYRIITDSESELWAPVLIQWDQWTETLDQLIASETALRKLFHQDLPVVIQGVWMWSEYTDGAELATPERAGFYGRAARFRHTPIRQALREGRSS